MIAGAFIFGAGIAFENAFLAQDDDKAVEEKEDEKVSPLVLRQWENLLGYDGNEQEGFDENI